MNRALNALYPIALAAGLAGIAGAGMAAARNHPVALAMTVLIAAFFAIAAWELAAFRRDSRGLAASAARKVPDDDWMPSVPVALRGAVQMRLDGLRVVLPGLALAPAIAGLLVLLGMLGTFIGLVITLGSTASALGASADLSALRSALGAPIQGLGLAFSASVAGVAGSAMLGLMVALARRERSAAGALLDAALLGRLRPLTSAHRREIEQRAADAAAIEREDARQATMLAQLQQFTERIADQLSAQNSRFHSETGQAYAALASSVDATLRTSLAEAAREAGAAIEPAAAAAMAGIAREAASLHERVGTAVADQLAALGSRFEQGAARIAHQHEAADQARSASLQAHIDSLAGHQASAREVLAQAGQQFAEQAEAAVSTLADAFARLQARQGSDDADRLAAWRSELVSAGAAQSKQQQELADGLLANTRSLVAQAESHSQRTLADAGALLQAAGEAPRAAVEVVAALREQLVQSQAQDRAALVERAELMQTVSTLLASLQQAAGDQRAAIDSLVDRSAVQLEALGQRFTTLADASGQALADAATNLAASAADVACVGEGFGEAVAQFQLANAQLLQHLGVLEERLSSAITRSDDQLGYYVAQAREVIDLCLGSQKQVLDALQGAAAHG
ncbi:hypothetical protein [Pelomonas sp. KK5]|uniref:hypothetical protein n=1 Tax=Pelomonas sp. KK5 TaxID=1855730 RepID=UPI00097C1ED9|nr:hypothetical protein [Pelomonas sp. KK5]